MYRGSSQKGSCVCSTGRGWTTPALENSYLKKSSPLLACDSAVPVWGCTGAVDEPMDHNQVVQMELRGRIDPSKQGSEMEPEQTLEPSLTSKEQWSQIVMAAWIFFLPSCLSCAF